MLVKFGSHSQVNGLGDKDLYNELRIKKKYSVLVLSSVTSFDGRQSKGIYFNGLAVAVIIQSQGQLLPMLML